MVGSRSGHGRVTVGSRSGHGRATVGSRPGHGRVRGSRTSTWSWPRVERGSAAPSPSLTWKMNDSASGGRFARSLVAGGCRAARRCRPASAGRHGSGVISQAIRRIGPGPPCRRASSPAGPPVCRAGAVGQCRGGCAGGCRRWLSSQVWVARCCWRGLVQVRFGHTGLNRVVCARWSGTSAMSLRICGHGGDFEACALLTGFHIFIFEKICIFNSLVKVTRKSGADVRRSIMITTTVPGHTRRERI